MRLLAAVQLSFQREPDLVLRCLSGLSSAHPRGSRKRAPSAGAPAGNPARNTFDRHFGGDRVHDHDDGRRQQHAERPEPHSEPRHISRRSRFESASGRATFRSSRRSRRTIRDRAEDAASEHVTCMSRPGSHPSHGDRPSNISSEQLRAVQDLAIHTNERQRREFQYAVLLQNDWKRFTSGGVVVKNCSPNHPRPRARCDPDAAASSTATTSRSSAIVSVLTVYTVSEKSPRARRSSSAARRRLSAAQHVTSSSATAIQKMMSRDEARLRDPARNPDEALRDFVDFQLS